MSDGRIKFSKLLESFENRYGNNFILVNMDSDRKRRLPVKELIQEIRVQEDNDPCAVWLAMLALYGACIVEVQFRFNMLRFELEELMVALLKNRQPNATIKNIFTQHSFTQPNEELNG